MKPLFQRLNRPGSDSAVARLTLGAFGKHPGWDDHVLGLGVETDALAQVKEMLYVAGIGGQIDSGAWKKLEDEKRLRGFDHTFLWLMPGHTLLGQLWSSTDRKGRAKYPMVLCIDGEGVSPAFLLSALFPGLERLRGACQATNSPEQVTNDCRAGQEQLRELLASESSKREEKSPPLEVRRCFLEHGRLGPDRVGLLRVMHGLSLYSAVAPGPRAASGSTALGLRSSHLRLPLAADQPNQALLLWVTLLRCVVPEAVPLLLISRKGVDWLDAIINKPLSDDFFCLQASEKALPLTTEIPYHLAPDVKQRWQAVESEFLGTGAASFVAVPSSNPPPPPPLTPGAPQITAPPLPSQPVALSTPATLTKPSSKRLFIGGGAFVVLLALGLLYLFHRPNPESQQMAARNPGPQAQHRETPTVVGRTPDQTQMDRAYPMALAAALAAKERKDYSNAIVQVGIALKAKPGDATAVKVLQEVQQITLAAAQLEKDYEKATNAAGLALLQRNYPEATNQAGIALAIKAADPEASKLMTDGQHAITLTASNSQQHRYQAATNAAGLALIQMNYPEATNQAGVALAINPADPVASKLMAEALQAIAVAATQDQQQKYQAATNAAVLALAQGKWQEATNHAGKALVFKPGDPMAAKLISDTIAAWQKDQNFQASTNAAGLALSQGKYLEASKAAAAALSLVPDQPQALRLKVQADEGIAFETAKKYLDAGQFAEAAEVCRTYSSVDVFKSLAARISAEQKAFDGAHSSLTRGDYTFIEVLKTQDYSGKMPFSNLLSQAVQERASLDSLQRLRAADAREEMKKRLAAPELAGLLVKPPFAELRTWADSPVATTVDAKQQVLAGLDEKLEVLLVQFSVLKPTAREIQSERARRTKAFPSGALDDPQFFLDKVQQLQNDYTKGGWFDANRKKYIDKLTEAINNR